MSKLPRLPRQRASSLDVLHRRESSDHNLEDVPSPPTSWSGLSPVQTLDRSVSEGGNSSSPAKEKVSARLNISSMSSLEIPPLPSSPQQPLAPTGFEHQRIRSFSSPHSASRRRSRKLAVNSWDGSSDIHTSTSKKDQDTTATEGMSQRSSSWDRASFGPYREKLKTEVGLDSSLTDDKPPPPPPLSPLPPGLPPPGMTGSSTFMWLSSGTELGDSKPVSFEEMTPTEPSSRHRPAEKQLGANSSEGGNGKQSTRVTFRRKDSLVDDDGNENVIYNMDRYGMDCFDGGNDNNDDSMRWGRRQDLLFSPTPNDRMSRMERDDDRYDRSASPSPSPARSRKSPQSQQQHRGWWTWLWCDFCPIPPPKKPAWTRVSSFIVRHAPCFCWCVSPLETSATDRAVLYRLNILCAVFASVQAAVGVFMAIVLVAYPTDGNSADGLKRAFSLWDLNTGLFLLAGVSAVLFVITMYSLRFIRQVNILGAVRYMWALYWMLPIHIFLVIGLFDYHRVTNVWVKHWWRGSVMEWYRTLFCASGTAHKECTVPINGGDYYTSEEEWCLKNYNSTECKDIRAAAETDTSTWCYIFYTANGIWGVLLVVLLLLTMDVLQGIITPPIVQASKEANIPAWLTLPIAGCFAIGCIFLLSQASITPSDDESIDSVHWIGTAYMVAAGTFTISALLGWFLSAFSVTNIQDKRRKKIAVTLFILTLILTILSVGAIFATSLTYAIDVTPISLDDDQRGSIACAIDGGVSCTNCDRPTRRCTEWSEEDIVKVVRTQLKLSATLAAIFFIYGFSALRFGFVLRSHIVNYQIDYV